MKVFEVRTKKNAGCVIVKFFDDGGFGGIDFTSCDGLSEIQIQWFLNHLPKNVDSLGIFLKAELKVSEVIDSITFDMFWKRYDDKLNSSRKRTLARWEKMPVKERVAAYNFIPKYFANIPMGTRKKYAETYLNSELWNN